MKLLTSVTGSLFSLSFRRLNSFKNVSSKKCWPSISNQTPLTDWKYQRRFQHNILNRENIVYSDYEDILVPEYNISEHIWKNLDKWPDKTAVVCGVSGRSYTYAQSYKMCVAFAASLRNKLKLTDGDCLAIMMANSPEYHLVLLGALQAGCVVTTINPAYIEDEIVKQLLNSNAKVIVIERENYDKVKKALIILKKNIHIIISGSERNESIPQGTIRFYEFSENFMESSECLKEVKRSGDDTALLPYSSGTTGLPKGVELTHNNITSNCLQIYSPTIPITKTPTDTDQDVIMCVLPLFHIYGLIVTMLSKLAIGSKMVTIPRFHPNTFLKAQRTYKSNLLFAAPPLVLFLANSTDVKVHHLESIETIMSGAAPLAKSDVERLLEKAKGKTAFVQGYGLTETSPLVSIQEKGDTNYDSIGKLIANISAMVVDVENMKPLGANQVGELWLHGPNVMKGYYNNPLASQEVIMPGGWLRTGDMAYYDHNQHFYITDRIKELIKVKGFQVAPAELEAILRSHPDITDAAVIGVPDPKFGELPKAFVVKRANKSPTVEEIKSFVANKVTEYKRLEEVHFIDAVPKNPSGKILRRELKRLFVNKL